MEDVLYRFLQLDPEVVKRYSKSERNLLQTYSIVVLIGSMSALSIWCTALYLLFNYLVALIGIALAALIWRYDTNLLTIRGFRDLLGRLVVGVAISIATTIFLSVVVYYQTAIYKAEQQAENTELNRRTEMGEKLEVYRLKVEAKYKPEFARINQSYNVKMDKLRQEQVRNAKEYVESGVKKEQKVAPTPGGFTGVAEIETDNTPNRASKEDYEYVETIIQKQMDMLQAQWDKDIERVYTRIESEVEQARQYTYYTPEIKPNVSIGNLGNIMTQTAFDRDTSTITLPGILYMICLIIEFLPFLIRVVVLSSTKFINENTN